VPVKLVVYFFEPSPLVENTFKAEITPFSTTPFKILSTCACAYPLKHVNNPV
jgi:hypothetical protein